MKACDVIDSFQKLKLVENYDKVSENLQAFFAYAFKRSSLAAVTDNTAVVKWGITEIDTP